MAKNDKKNHEKHTAAEPDLMPNIPGVDLSGMEDEQVGLPPYWGPSEEAMNQGVAQGFYAKVAAFDDKDPEFHRYVMQSMQPELLCHRGPADGAEEMMVKKGEFFSISDYNGLPLGQYMGLGPIFVYVKDKVATATAGRSVWVWGVKVDKATKAVLNERRQAQVLPQARAPHGLPASAS